MRAERHPWALHPPWGSHKLCSPLEGPPQGQVLAKPPCPPQGAGDSAWLCPHRQVTAGPRVPSGGMEAPRRGCCPALHGEERARTAQPSPAAAGENGAQATLPASGPENTGGKRCCLPLLSRSRSGYALLPSHASQTHKGNQLASFPWLRPTSFPPSRGLARGTFQLRLQTAAGTMEGAEAAAGAGGQRWPGGSGEFVSHTSKAGSRRQPRISLPGQGEAHTVPTSAATSRPFGGARKAQRGLQGRVPLSLSPTGGRGAPCHLAKDL